MNKKTEELGRMPIGLHCQESPGHVFAIDKDWRFCPYDGTVLSRDKPNPAPSSFGARRCVACKQWQNQEWRKDYCPNCGAFYANF